MGDDFGKDCAVQIEVDSFKKVELFKEKKKIDVNE